MALRDPCTSLPREVRNDRPCVAGSLQILPDPGRSLPAHRIALRRTKCPSRKAGQCSRRLGLGKLELALPTRLTTGFGCLTIGAAAMVDRLRQSTADRG